jgi:hypothetical protein
MKNIKESLLALFSTHKDALAKKGIKVNFEEQKFTKAVLADGTEIQTEAESWGEGVPVTTTDGTPLATGDYALPDGSILSVQDGMVVSLSAPKMDEEEEEMSAEEVAEALEVVAAEQAATIEAMTAEKEALEATVEAKTTELQNMSKQVEDLKAEVKKLAKLPAAQSVKHERQDKSDAPKTAGQEIMERLSRKQQVFGTQSAK